MIPHLPKILTILPMNSVYLTTWKSVFLIFYILFFSYDTSYFFYKVDYLLTSERSKEDELCSLMEPDYF